LKSNLSVEISIQEKEIGHFGIYGIHRDFFVKIFVNKTSIEKIICLIRCSVQRQ